MTAEATMYSPLQSNTYEPIQREEVEEQYNNLPTAAE